MISSKNAGGEREANQLWSVSKIDDHQLGFDLKVGIKDVWLNNNKYNNISISTGNIYSAPEVEVKYL